MRDGADLIRHRTEAGVMNTELRWLFGALAAEAITGHRAASFRRVACCRKTQEATFLFNEQVASGFRISVSRTTVTTMNCRIAVDAWILLKP